MKQKGKVLAGTLIGLGAAAAALGICGKKFADSMDRPPVAEPDLQKIRIACIGDSITFGAGLLFRGREKNVWTALLNGLLGENYQVLNYGISGATLQREGDKSYRDFPQLEKAKEAKASIYLLMLGTNDSKPYNWDPQRYETQLSEWISELKEVGDGSRLILMTPPFTCPAKGKKEVAFDILNEVIRDEIRPTVMRAAEENGLQVIDLYAFTEGHGEWFADGVHPNKLGNQKIAEEICAQVRQIEDAKTVDGDTKTAGADTKAADGDARITGADVKTDDTDKSGES